MQADLFAPALLPGLACADALVTEPEEHALAAAIDAAGLAAFRFHGWTGRRLTASFGWRYDFTDGSFRAAAPIPDWLLPLRARAAGLAQLEPDALAQVLLTRYDPGAGIGWHRDKAVFGVVIGISLGAPAVMRFRRPRPGGFHRAALPLAPRSAYALTGEAREAWEHSIAPMPATRWSVTFRTLR